MEMASSSPHASHLIVAWNAPGSVLFCGTSSHVADVVPREHGHGAADAQGLLDFLAVPHDLADHDHGLLMDDAAAFGDNLLGIPEGGSEIALLVGGLGCSEERCAHLLRVVQCLVARCRALGRPVGLVKVAVGGNQCPGDHLHGAGLALRIVKLLVDGQGRLGGRHQLLFE
eukprot:UN4946